MIDLSALDIDALQAELVKRGTPAEITRGLHLHHQQLVFDAEHAKDHSLSSLRLPEDEWCKFRNHMLNGEGVSDPHLPLKDGRTLQAKLEIALDTNDQEQFWQLMPHLIKCHLRASGRINALPGGGVARGAHGNPALEAARASARAAFEQEK